MEASSSPKSSRSRIRWKIAIPAMAAPTHNAASVASAAAVTIPVHRATPARGNHEVSVRLPPHPVS